MHRARAGLSLTVAAGMAIVALAGCHNPQAGGLTIAGSTSVQPVAEMLAKDRP